MSKKINGDNFIRSAHDIKRVISVLESHKGLFIVGAVEYDAILYCGTDNLYFSYCFNYTTGKAISETLLIVDTIIQVSERSYLVKSLNSETLVYLKE